MIADCLSSLILPPSPLRLHPSSLPPLPLSPLPSTLSLSTVAFFLSLFSLNTSPRSRTTPRRLPPHFRAPSLLLFRASLSRRRAAIALILEHGKLHHGDAMAHGFKTNKNPARGAGDVRQGAYR